MNTEEKKILEINVSRFLFVVMNLLLPLVFGRLFGIIAERFAYGIVICVISLKYTEMVIVLDGIDVMFEEATKELERKMKDHDPAD